MRDTVWYQILGGGLAAAICGMAGTMMTSEAKAVVAALVAGIIVGTGARSWRAIVIAPFGYAAGVAASRALGSVGPAWSIAWLPVTVGLALLGAANVTAVRRRPSASQVAGSHSPENGA
ncbi:MAG TPA: hypothetical protein VFU72_13525 [Nitrolancea sp.]|nr:hypothetical protein [Nitrolancea sp.]